MSGRLRRWPSADLSHLRGAWAVVTGASSGLGAEFARQLGGLGLHLVVAARRRPQLEMLRKNLSQHCGVNVIVVQVDLGDEEGAETLYQHACAEERTIQMLINNAGCGVYGPFTERLLAAHTATIEPNVTALTHLSHRFATHMLAHGQPSYITHVASVTAYTAFPYFAVYAGTKAYVRHFSEALRVELRDSNIHVTCVCPGGTATEFPLRAGQYLTPFGQRALMRCEGVVRHTLRGMVHKDGIVIPGVHNKWACWMLRRMPERLAVRLAFLVMQWAAAPKS